MIDCLYLLPLLQCDVFDLYRLYTSGHIGAIMKGSIPHYFLIIFIAVALTFNILFYPHAQLLPFFCPIFSIDALYYKKYLCLSLHAIERFFIFASFLHFLHHHCIFLNHSGYNAPAFYQYQPSLKCLFQPD